jgi:hypothetical protein
MWDDYGTSSCGSFARVTSNFINISLTRGLDLVGRDAILEFTRLVDRSDVKVSSLALLVDLPVQLLSQWVER